ncbi:LamG-like jellyroll fold domain-containing protein [Winogradskya humida]|uniref:Fibronectin type-III domain-containing protein n=1 Tax=Winogradskya humida TaxID=113566 RepID=A0ABQ3ZMC5_9ACTN|nr:LamG-like jellyroll fold domain-containing protein [Actinoplanes humidus]GIE19749.1 hypothetical protein Ahu01nite_028510 [Actinoplanes humidus]
MRRRWILLLLIAGALSIGGGVAWAYWTAPATPGSTGGSSAASLPAGVTPTVLKKQAQAVTVSWSAVTLSNGVAVSGYVVKRYDTATLTTQTVLSGCTGTITALTCTENTMPTGSWRYTVYPVYGANWAGAESPLSTSVATGPATLTLAQTLFNGPFPATTTGTVAGFGANEAYTYRLDSSTTMTGFPTVVDVTGGAPISSLSIPSATDGPHTVSVIGANGSLASTTITIDTVPPVVSSLQSPVVNGNGWNTSSPVTVTLSAIDATTSVAAIRYTTDGSDPTVSGTAITYTTPFTVAASATVRYFATDIAGNASAVGSRAIQIDLTAPANALTVTSATGALLSGTTLYYRGVAVGSFTIRNAVSDAGSGPASSGTAALAGTSTGFSHTASTVTTPSGGPYVSNAFTWTGGTTSAPTETVTGADVAGNTTPTTLSFVNDSTAPAGGSAGGPAYSTSTTVNVALSRGTDSGVGLDTAAATLQRATATLTNNSCGTYNTPVTITTTNATTYADTVTDQACYRYTYVVSDLLGNTVTYPAGTPPDVKVDTTAPSTPTFSYASGTNTYAAGSTLYYRSSQTSGSFTVTPSSTDAATGITGFTYPTFGGTWSRSGTTYSWTGGTATVPASTTVTATNNAGLTASAAMTLTSDITAPAGGTVTYANGYAPSNSPSIAFTTGTETGSGINASTGLLQRRSAAMTIPGGTCGTYGSWATIYTGATSPFPDGPLASNFCYQYQYTVSDNVGNTSAPYVGANTIKMPLYFTCAAAIAAITPATDGWWKLNDSTTTAVDSGTKTNTGTYSGTYTQNVIGGVCNNATAFDGTSGYVYTTNQVAYPGPVTYSEEIWFKTTTTDGGKLIGYGDQRTSKSGNYDRHIFMTKNGKLNFGVTNGLLNLGVTTITSPNTYNDGAWHHAAATMSAAGMRFYVDGLQVATNASTTSQYLAGYWRIGGDTLSGYWPLFATGSDFFNGTLSNAAVWNTYAMTATEVWNHFTAGVAGSTAGTVNASSIATSIQSAPNTTRRTPPSVTTSPSPSSSPSSTPSLIPSPSFSAPLTSPTPSPSSGPTPTAPTTPPSLPPLTPIPSYLAPSDPTFRSSAWRGFNFSSSLN